MPAVIVIEKARNAGAIAAIVITMNINEKIEFAIIPDYWRVVEGHCFCVLGFFFTGTLQLLDVCRSASGDAEMQSFLFFGVSGTIDRGVVI